ncbi:MAG: tRNA guanosine(34) transglycosylase Tgt [Rhodospirillaceae bacterium]|nr:tRNA guanosine(34) transglycosylase Tgt [Rhodospirillaceae bacterium]
MSLSFSIKASDGNARAGLVRTAHGSFLTPAFMPVGTGGTVKAMTPDSLASSGSDIVLANTYHLMLRPGPEIVKALGGLRKMMGWPGPVLTDSGGFQVMSLSKLRKLTEDGVIFKSHIDGKEFFLSPEKSVAVQETLDATISMVLDECTAYPCSKEEAEKSMDLSMVWAVRSKEAFNPRPGYGLFGIVQGGVHCDLRKESVIFLKEQEFDGYAIGGLAVGEDPSILHKVASFTAGILPPEKPRYLMGVGRPEDLVQAISAGCDMFDCVLPTRSGRTGQAFTHRGTVNIRNSRHRSDLRPLDEACECPTCLSYTRGYLHHLVRSGEILGSMLMTWHNIHYYQSLMASIRSHILAGELSKFENEFRELYLEGDVEPLG